MKMEPIRYKDICIQRFQPAVDAIQRLIDQQGDVLVAIDGRCASGKTTLGFYLQSVFRCNLFHMDDFFLRNEQRTSNRISEIGGNVDYERFKEEVLQPLIEKRTVNYRVFSCQTRTIVSEEEMPYCPVNIIEGSYSQHPYFQDPYQLHVFLTIDQESQLKNIKERNGVEKLEDFKKLWIPKEEAYFKKFPVEKNSLVISWKYS